MQDYENAIDTGRAVVVLHNYILQRCNKKKYMDPGSVIREDDDGNIFAASWEQEVLCSLDPMNQLSGNRSGNRAARLQRDFIAKGFLTDEKVPWQFKQAFRTN